MMSKNKTVRIRNLTAKAASLFLAVVVWYLVKILLVEQRRTGKEPERPNILGPAVNPDLQVPEQPVEPEKEKPTVH